MTWRSLFLDIHYLFLVLLLWTAITISNTTTSSIISRTGLIHVSDSKRNGPGILSIFRLIGKCVWSEIAP
jgi:hypothetical protein